MGGPSVRGGQRRGTPTRITVARVKPTHPVQPASRWPGQVAACRHVYPSAAGPITSKVPPDTGMRCAEVHVYPPSAGCTPEKV